ncbi:MAG TPA: tetratricopeptide repeat protein [Terriglobia bacterium]|nr:tetratricopeptide repeat protein [Terriglobia bacterium]
MRKTIHLVSFLILMPGACQNVRAATARTILIFPFINQSSRADLGWISEGLAEILASRLVAPDRYILGRDELNAAYAQLELPPGKSLTLASDYKIAEILGVDWAVMGSFDVVGTRLTAQASLLDARGLKLSRPIEATGELSDMVELQTDLAWRLLAAHDPDFVVGREEDFQHRLPEVRLDAFENYIRGILSTDDDSRVRFLTEADRRYPQDHQAAFQLGRYYFDRKDYARSGTWLRKLNDGDPNYLESLFLQGVSEYFLGQEGASEKVFAQLAKQIPLNEVSNNLGVMEARRHDFADALAEFERAYQADPSDPDFSFNMGVCLWYLKRYNEADKSLKQALSIDDDDIGAHTLLALVSGKLGEDDRQRVEQKWITVHEGVSISNGAEEDILPQTRIKKHYDGHAFRLLALTVQNAEERNLASKSPAEHAQFHVTKGKRLLAAGRSAEAERELTEAVSLIPEDYQVHMDLAQVLEAEGKHQEAAGELATSLKLKDSVAAHILLARVYLSLNRADAARTQGEAALSLDPGNQEAARLVQQIQARAPETRRLP